MFYLDDILSYIITYCNIILYNHIIFMIILFCFLNPISNFRTLKNKHLISIVSQLSFA